MTITAALALVYGLLAHLSGQISGLLDSEGAFWLPIGLIFAVALGLGRAGWAGIFMGQWGYEMLLGTQAWGTALLLATGNLLCVATLTLLCGPRPATPTAAPASAPDPLDTPATLLKCLGALVLASALNATFGTLAFRHIGQESVESLLGFVLTFMGGDLSGALLLGPLLLKLSNWRSDEWRHRRLEFWALLAASIGVLHLMLTQRDASLLAVATGFVLVTSVGIALRHSISHLTVFHASMGLTLTALNRDMAALGFGGDPVESLVATKLLLLTICCTSLLCAIHRRMLAAAAAHQAKVNRMLARTEDQARIGSWQLDLRLNRLSWSEQTHRLFGRDPNNSVPDYEHFLSLVHPEDRAALDAAWQAALKGAPYDHVHRIVVNGQVRWMHERAEFEFGPDGQPVSAWGSVQDVTERILQEQMVRERERASAANEAKSRFLATLSHEIRTPLNGVIGLTQLLQDPDLDPGTQRSYHQQLQNSARLLNDIVSDVLDLSKIEAGQMKLDRQPFALVDTLERLVQGFQPAAQLKHLNLTLTVEPGMPQWVMGDATRVSQIAQNFVSNALKFTDRGHVRVTLSRQATEMILQVEDSGVGIPAPMLPELFKPFVQVDRSVARRHGGTGLGLSICRELAALMGGRVEAHSLEGQGSTFRAILPLEAAQAPQPPANVPFDPAPLQDLRILLADDNAVNVLIATRLLERLGASVTVAQDGLAALQALGLRSADGGVVDPIGAEVPWPVDHDLVLLDVEMPVLDGLAVARAVRQAEAQRSRIQADVPRLPLLAMTAGVMDTQRQAARDAGMDDFIAKPINVTNLVETIRRHRRGAASKTPAAADAPLCKAA